MSLPVLRLSGSPYEMGKMHGSVLKDRISHNVHLYYDRFLREIHLDRTAVREVAVRFARLAESSCPDYVAGMRGVEEGSREPWGSGTRPRRRVGSDRMVTGAPRKWRGTVTDASCGSEGRGNVTLPPVFSRCRDVPFAVCPSIGVQTAKGTLGLSTNGAKRHEGL